jgi:hypothetical protein
MNHTQAREAFTKNVEAARLATAAAASKKEETDKALVAILITEVDKRIQEEINKCQSELRVTLVSDTGILKQMAAHYDQRLFPVELIQRGCNGCSCDPPYSSCSCGLNGLLISWA